MMKFGFDNRIRSFLVCRSEQISPYVDTHECGACSHHQHHHRVLYHFDAINMQASSWTYNVHARENDILNQPNLWLYSVVCVAPIRGGEKSLLYYPETGWDFSDSLRRNRMGTERQPQSECFAVESDERTSRSNCMLFMWHFTFSSALIRTRTTHTAMFALRCRADNGKSREKESRPG